MRASGTPPVDPAPPSPDVALVERRSRIVAALSALMIAMYFGFMGLFAFDKPLLGTVLAPGLTLCLVLGPAVIAASCLVSLGYVLWANLVFDPAAARLADDMSSTDQGTHHGE